MPKKKSKENHHHRKSSTEDTSLGSEKNNSTGSSEENVHVTVKRKTSSMGNFMGYSAKQEEKSATPRESRSKAGTRISIVNSEVKRSKSRVRKSHSSQNPKISPESSKGSRSHLRTESPVVKAASVFVSEIRSKNNVGKKKSQVKFSESHDHRKQDRSKVISNGQPSASRKSALVPMPKDSSVRKSLERKHRLHSKDQPRSKVERDDNGSGSESDENTNSVTSGSSEGKHAAPPIDPTTTFLGPTESIVEALPPLRKHQSKSKTKASSNKEKDPEKEQGSTSSGSFVSTTELLLVSLPLDTNIDQLKELFPDAKAIKLVLLRAKNKYQRNATVEFTSSSIAYKAYKKTRHVKIGSSNIKFNFSLNGTFRQIDTNENEDNRSVDTIEDLLPKDEIDKEAMIREWIDFQNDYIRRKKSKTRYSS